MTVGIAELRRLVEANREPWLDDGGGGYQCGGCQRALYLASAELEPVGLCDACVSELTDATPALLDEIERLRVVATKISNDALAQGRADIQAKLDGDIAAVRESAELQVQLVYMTAARDEACDIAARHIFAPTAASVPLSQATTTELRSGIVVVDSGAPYRDKVRVAELRKVGAP